MWYAIHLNNIKRLYLYMPVLVYPTDRLDYKLTSLLLSLADTLHHSYTPLCYWQLCDFVPQGCTVHWLHYPAVRSLTIQDVCNVNKRKRHHKLIRARTYRLFCSFGLNSYLKCVKIEKFKFALCRFRVSAHRLAVEAGRWHTHTYKKYLFRVT